MFKVEVIGNLGADAEVKDGNGGKFIAFRVANTDKWTTESGEKHESTTWIDVTMSNVDSKVLPYLKAGVKVFVRVMPHCVCTAHRNCARWWREFKLLRWR